MSKLTIKLCLALFMASSSTLVLACSAPPDARESAAQSAAGLRVEPLSSDHARLLTNEVARRGEPTKGMLLEEGKQAPGADASLVVGVPDLARGWWSPTFAVLVNEEVVQVDRPLLISKAKTGAPSAKPQDDGPSGGGGGTTCDYARCSAAQAYEEETLENYVSALGTDPEVAFIYALVWYNATVATVKACGGC